MEGSAAYTEPDVGILNSRPPASAYGGSSRDTHRVLWLGASKAIPAVFAFVLLLAQVHYLRPKQYVSLSLLTPVCILSANLGNSGIRQRILRDYSYDEQIEKLPLLAGPLGLAAILTGVLSFALGLALTAEVTSAFGAMVYATGQSLAVGQQTLIQARDNAKRLALFEISRFGLMVLLGSAAVITFRSTAAALIGGGLPFIISAISWDLRRYRLHSIEFGRKLRRLKEASSSEDRFSLIMTVWVAITTLFQYADRFLLQCFGLGYSAIATYSKCYDLTLRLSSLALFPFVLGFHPRISREFRWKSYRDGRRLVARARRWMLSISVIIVVGVWIAYPLICPLLKLPRGNPAVLVLLSLSACLWCTAQVSQKEAELTGHGIGLVVLAGITATGNIVVNVVLLALGESIRAVALCNVLSVIAYLLSVEIYGAMIRRRQGAVSDETSTLFSEEL